MPNELIAALEKATRNVPALFGAVVMIVMLAAYPSAITGLKDVTEACIMLTLGAGHLAALWCCIAALRATERGEAGR